MTPFAPIALLVKSAYAVAVGPFNVKLRLYRSPESSTKIVSAVSGVLMVEPSSRWPLSPKIVSGAKMPAKLPGI